MLKADNPCYKCSDRHIVCHASCEKYKDWAKKLENDKRKVMNERNVELDVIGHIVDTIRSNKKRNHR